MRVAFNFELAKNKTLEAITNYLLKKEEEIKGEVSCFSFFYSTPRISKGITRAKKLRAVLSHPECNTAENVLAVLLALFGEHNESCFSRIGSSQVLAYHCASQFLSGTYIYECSDWPRIYKQDLSSPIFDPQSLKLTTDNDDNFFSTTINHGTFTRDQPGKSYDYNNGVRHLLSIVRLNNFENQTQQNITDKAARFKSFFDNTSLREDSLNSSFFNVTKREPTWWESFKARF